MSPAKASVTASPSTDPRPDAGGFWAGGAAAGSPVAAFVCGDGPVEVDGPAVGSEVPAPPPALRLRFTEAIELAFSAVTVTDAGGRRVDQGSPGTDEGGRILVVHLAPLLPGLYVVAWQVTSVDTHRTQGHFSFTVKP